MIAFDTLAAADFPGARDLQRQLAESRRVFLAMLSPPRQDAPGLHAAPPAPDTAGSSDSSARSTP